MAKWLEKIDKNGTEYWADNTCRRCGGRGASEAWRYTGCICYECGGSGISTPHIEKVYTPEYAEILRKKREAQEAKRVQEYTAKRIAEAQEKNERFMNRFFNLTQVAMITESSYGITDDLKAEGARFIPELKIWIAKETSRQHIIIALPAITTFNDFGELEFVSYEIIQDYFATQKREQSTATYFGKVGDRLELTLKVVNVYRFEAPAYGRPWMTETTYINKLVDDDGNIFIWKTTARCLTGTVTLVGTIKEHLDYNGEKQTILTRCKVKE